MSADERRPAPSETQSAADRQTAFLIQLLEAIPTPVFYKDSTQIYRGCNKAFERFLGRGREEIVDKTVFDVAPPDLAQRYFRTGSGVAGESGSSGIRG